MVLDNFSDFSLTFFKLLHSLLLLVHTLVSLNFKSLFIVYFHQGKLLAIIT